MRLSSGATTTLSTRALTRSTTQISDPVSQHFHRKGPLMRPTMDGPKSGQSGLLKVYRASKSWLVVKPWYVEGHSSVLSRPFFRSGAVPEARGRNRRLDAVDWAGFAFPALQPDESLSRRGGRGHESGSPRSRSIHDCRRGNLVRRSRSDRLLVAQESRRIWRAVDLRRPAVSTLILRKEVTNSCVYVSCSSSSPFPTLSQSWWLWTLVFESTCLLLAVSFPKPPKRAEPLPEKR